MSQPIWGKARSESDFESVYNLDDSMQSCEYSFFDGFRYEGDDHQEISRDEVRFNRVSTIHSRNASRSPFTKAHPKQREFSLQTTQTEEKNKSTFLLSDCFLDEVIENRSVSCKTQIILPSQSFAELHPEQTKKAVNEAILTALRQGKRERILQIINDSYYQGILDVNFKDIEGMTIVLVCCETGNLEILRVIASEMGGNISVIDSIRKRVGLHYACLGKHPEIVQYLLSQNSTLKNFQDSQGCTPLFYASQSNCRQCVDILLANDVHIGLTNNEGLTPLDIATDSYIQKKLLAKMGLQYQLVFDQLGLRTEEFRGSEFLRRNSRKDRIALLLHKVKFLQPPPTQLQNGKIGGRKRKEIMDSLFKEQVKKVQEKIKKQAQYEKELLLNEEKEKLKNSPIKIRRKVTLDDFIFYRNIGRGSYGEVYLVKLKESVFKKRLDKVEENENKAGLELEDIEGGEEMKAKIEERIKMLKRQKPNDEQEDPSQKFYALKMIRKDALKRQKLIDYIETEKEVMQSIQHPFLATLHLSFETDSHLFLLMEFLLIAAVGISLDQGGDLGRILEKEIEVDEEQVKVWAAQIVLAIEVLHKNDIVYRDLKPENVVFDAKGNLHLIDFGLAKKGVTELTNSFCGTPIYLSPEIIGKIGHNKMVDWYSLGVIIYELLVGRPPYFSHDCKQLFNDIQTQPLRLPKSLSESSKSILIGLLKKNYQRRLGFQADADEVKSHPWFQDIKWEDVYNKKYHCMKPMLLTIPSRPISVNLNSKGDAFSVVFKQKWSFYNIEEDLSPKDQ